MADIFRQELNCDRWGQVSVYVYEGDEHVSIAAADGFVDGPAALSLAEVDELIVALVSAKVAMRGRR